MNKVLYLNTYLDSGKFIVSSILGNSSNVYHNEYVDRLLHNYIYDTYYYEESLVLNDDDKVLVDTFHNISKDDHFVKKAFLIKNGTGIDSNKVFSLFLFRDIRLCWLVSEHKPCSRSKLYKVPIELYTQRFNEIFNKYLNQRSDKLSFYVKFEDLLINTSETHKRICKLFDVNFNSDAIPSSFKRSLNYFSMFDVEKIIKFRKQITNEELDYISSLTKDYNEFFGYPNSLTIEDMLHD